MWQCMRLSTNRSSGSHSLAMLQLHRTETSDCEATGKPHILHSLALDEVLRSAIRWPRCGRCRMDTPNASRMDNGSSSARLGEQELALEGISELGWYLIRQWGVQIFSLLVGLSLPLSPSANTKSKHVLD